MTIYQPDQPGIDLGNSSLRPRDTYAAPTRLDQGMSDGQALGKALAGLGEQFASLGQAAQSKQEKEDMSHVDILAAQQELGIRSDLQSSSPTSGPLGVQLGNIFPWQSSAVQGRVDERRGDLAAQQFAMTTLPQLMADKDAQTNPQAFEGKLQELRRQALSQAGSNLSYGQGFIKRFDQEVERARSVGLASLTQEYSTRQAEQQVQDTLDASNHAIDNAHTPVGDAALPNLRSLQVRASEGAESINKLNGTFATRIDSMVSNMPPELKVKLTIDSAARSQEHQAQIYAQAQAEHGSDARKWAAPPGHSNHQFGEAVDLGFSGDPQVRQWVHDNAQKYGLYFPLSNEDWHIEMIGGRRQGGTGYGQAPAGMDHGSPVDHVVNTIVGNPSVEGYGKNPYSSAQGVGQFTDGTFLSNARKYVPDLVAGKSDAEILALRKDPAIASQVLRGFTQANADKLKAQGLPVTEGNLYLMHFAGEGDAPKVLRAADQTKVRDVMNPYSIQANPQIANMTVGEMKEWAAKKMGNSVDPTAAAQNAVRRTDMVYARSSGMPSTFRRDNVVDGLKKMAIQTGDASYIDRIPPEYINPQIAAELEAARRQANEVKYSQAEHERQLQKIKDEKTLDDGTKAINEKLLAGKPIDLAKDTRNPDGSINNKLFSYAREQQGINLALDPTQSKVNLRNAEDDLITAAATNDYSKFDPRFKAGQNVSMRDIRQAIMDNKTMRSDEKGVMLDRLEKTVEAGSLSQSPEAKSTYAISVDTYAKTLQQGMTGKPDIMAAMMKVNYAGEAKTFYDRDIRNRIKAYVMDNHQLPKAQEAQAIYDASAARTTTFLKQLSEAVQSGDKGAIDKASIMGKDPNAATEAQSLADQYTVIRQPDGTMKIERVQKSSTTAPVAQPQAQPTEHASASPAAQPSASAPAPTTASVPSVAPHGVWDTMKRVASDFGVIGGGVAQDASNLGDYLTSKSPQELIDLHKDDTSPLGRAIVSHQKERQKYYQSHEDFIKELQGLTKKGK